MEENQEVVSQEEVAETDTAQENVGEDIEPTQPVSFTQEQVNNIVRDRLARQQNQFYSKYGVSDNKAFDDLVGKGKAYRTLIRELAKARNDSGTLTEELAFMRNNINPSKYDDIRTHFKGSGQKFSEEALLELLKDRPEWVNATERNNPTTTISKLGVESKPKVAESEEDKIKRLFGV